MLVITMTIIGLIGASIASLMGAKHKELPFQLNSYNALCLANAGVEWATRYIIYDYGPYPDSTTGTTVRLPGVGVTNQFTVRYQETASGGIPADTLRSTGDYQGANREVRINQFRRQFVGTISKITIRSLPYTYYGHGYVYIPFFSNGSQNLTITSATITQSGTGQLRLLNIYNWIGFWDNIYSSFLTIPVNTPTTITIPFPSTHNPDARSWWAIGFVESGTQLVRDYTIQFSGTVGGVPFTSTIKFNPTIS